MISKKRLEEQLKRINFHPNGWGHTEIYELTNILMPEEEIEECVNGYYEAGFALMVATKDRMLLVDKKPMGYLTVEDMRFDMINELDLHHRLLGAQIKVSAGAKTLHFTSLNQVRLRRLLSYVQARMTQIKKDSTAKVDEQKRHLEEMNEQLRLYLMAAHKQQYLDQARSIAGGAPLASESPVAALYGPPPKERPAETTSVAAPIPTDAATQTARDTANNPFERVAAAAFDNSQAEPSVAAGASRAPKPISSHRQEQTSGQIITPQQLGLAAARRVIPIISAYSKLPMLQRSRDIPLPPVNPEPV
jgi:hypothetical protein